MTTIFPAKVTTISVLFLSLVIKNVMSHAPIRIYSNLNLMTVDFWVLNYMIPKFFFSFTSLLAYLVINTSCFKELLYLRFSGALRRHIDHWFSYFSLSVMIWSYLLHVWNTEVLRECAVITSSPGLDLQCLPTGYTVALVCCCPWCWNAAWALVVLISRR